MAHEAERAPVSGSEVAKAKKMVSALGRDLEALRSASRKITVPPEFFCPITLEVMEDPVVAADGAFVLIIRRCVTDSHDMPPFGRIP